jgi:hypothetical protein
VFTLISSADSSLPGEKDIFAREDSFTAFKQMREGQRTIPESLDSQLLSAQNNLSSWDSIP